MNNYSLVTSFLLRPLNVAIIMLFFVCSMLSGCQGKTSKVQTPTSSLSSETSPSSNMVNNESETSDNMGKNTYATTNKASVNVHLRHCNKQQSPPIKDKNKIAEMLIKSGKLDPTLSNTEQQNIINNYIRQKQISTSGCKPLSKG